MPLQKPLADYDSLVTITDYAAVEQLGDAALVGNWFFFLKAEWVTRSGMAQLLAASGATGQAARSSILFRGGKEPLTLPGARLDPKTLPVCKLVSLTSDKALYRANRDTVRLLIAAPQQPNASRTLRVMLNSSVYADYPVTLDEYGLCLWSLRDLPEGEYEAMLPSEAANVCRFEVAEYRLAALNAELAEQQLSNETLHYVVAVTAFGQPYTGRVEVELQERGQRIGKRMTIQCDSDGICRGEVKLVGAGPFTLNILAGERTASVALKGSEQERRESITISELGEMHYLSMLPLPDSNECRGMYVTRGGTNTVPFFVHRVIGNEIEIVARQNVEVLRIATIDATRGSSTESYAEQVKAEQTIRLSIPQPYGVVLLGAFVDGQAWEGWCAVLHPSDLALECQVPKEARPGSRIRVTLKTSVPERVVPVQLIVKDQRLIAPSDPQVEFAARIKQNLSEWGDQAGTGTIERQLSKMSPPFMRARFMRGANGGVRPMAATTGAFPVPPPVAVPPPSIVYAPSAPNADAAPTFNSINARPPQLQATQAAATMKGQALAQTATASLAKIRLSFPEIIYNTIVKVQGQAEVEVTLGEGLTRYAIEAFALSPEAMDWQRVETTVNAVLPVYGELTVSPFVFPGDPVMGRLDVGAESGNAFVEVRHDGEVLPLFFEHGGIVPPDRSVPSGSVVRFPVRPGAITALVRDASSGVVDVSERHVTEPGKLRHIMRRLQLLTAGEVVTLENTHALELKPMPGLERPFQFFVEGASKYPYG